MLSFLRFEDGQVLVTKPTNILFYLIAFFAGGLQMLDLAKFNFLLIWLILFAILAWNIKKSGLFRPQPTAKSLAILGLNLIISFYLLFFNSYSITPFLLVAVQPITISIIILFFKIPTLIGKKYYIYQASKKISRLTKLTTIGITGSYGKSSTKEFLANILSGNSKTLKTPKNINTEIGVAKLILQQLNSQYKYFVAEMGAYKKGEISVLARMCKPQIGIITAIAPQHLALFGSIEAIKRAKSELVHNLKTNGIAILNYDNNHCREIAKTLPTNITVHYYSTNPANKVSAVIKSHQQDNNTHKLTFNVLNEEISLSVNLNAPHFAQNLLAAVLAAKLLNVDSTVIKDHLNKLPLLESQIQIYQSPTNHLVIDDSYNANIDGVITAINELNKLASIKKKYLITMGLIELGNLTQITYDKLFNLIIDSNIQTFVLSKSAYKHFKAAAEKRKISISNNFILVSALNKAKSEIEPHIEKNSAVLLVNRVPANIKNWLKRKK